jgi:hypothetical protein
MQRTDLTFRPIIQKQKWYFSFNKDTGQVLNCSVTKKGNSVEISESLGHDIAIGLKNLSQYVVILQDGKYIVKSKTEMDGIEYEISSPKKAENRNVYKIDSNNIDDKISFKLDMKNKQWNIKINDNLGQEIENTLDMSKNIILNFYVTKKDDANILDYVLPVSLNNLIKQKTLTMEHKSNNIPSLYCRKLYDYSYEVVNG